MKISKAYLSKQIKNIIKEQVALETISAELAKTSITDPELFKDPAVIMEKFNSIFEIAGVIYENQMMLKENILELEEKINSLEISS